MRVAVIGAGGQLGQELLRVLPAETTVPLTRRDLDLRNPDAVTQRLARLAPTAVVNAAAYNRVDGAEDEPAEAVAGNALRPAPAAPVCGGLGGHPPPLNTAHSF